MGRLKLSSDYRTLYEITKAFKISHSLTTTTMKLLTSGLPIEYVRHESHNRIVKVVNLNEFWKFAEQNKTMFNFANLECGALGKEPTWVRKHRQSDYSFSKCGKRWSKEEDEKLHSMATSGEYTLFELSSYFKRTETSVKARIIRIKAEYNVKKKNRVSWNKEKVQTMLEMHEKGYDIAAISRVVNISENSVKKRMMKEGIR